MSKTKCKPSPKQRNSELHACIKHHQDAGAELMARIFQQLKTGVDIGFLDENQCKDPIFSYGNMSEQTGETMFFSEAA